jgi:hypothetical protein
MLTCCGSHEEARKPGQKSHFRPGTVGLMLMEHAHTVGRCYTAIVGILRDRMLERR